MKKTLFKSVFTIAFALAGLAAASLAPGADWPQFQGLDRNGISPETGLARSWPEGGPKVLWKVPLGKGYGGPAVQDGKIYILDRPNQADLDSRRDVLRCLDLNSGNELWTFAYGAPGKLSHDGSRNTPTVEKDRVYILSPFGDLHCVDLKTHKAVWKKSLVEDFEGDKIPTWGYTQSPFLYKNLLLVAPQLDKVSAAAYDKTTGEVVWTVPALPGRPAYYAPVAVTLDGVEQFVLASGISEVKGKEPVKGKTVGISPKDGKVLWSFDGWQTRNPIPSPMAVGKDRLFITGGYGEGSSMLEIKRVNGKFTVTEIYNTKACGSLLHQPLLYKDHFYVNSNGRYAPECHGLLCLTLDGKPLWQTVDSLNLPNHVSGLPDFERGALILADGMIFILDGKLGDLRLVEPNPECYTELASAEKIIEGKELWAPMALSDGKLLIRDQDQLLCLDVRNP